MYEALQPEGLGDLRSPVTIICVLCRWHDCAAHRLISAGSVCAASAGRLRRHRPVAGSAFPGAGLCRGQVPGDGGVSQAGHEPVLPGARALFVKAEQAGSQVGVMIGEARQLSAIWRIRHHAGAWRAAATSRRATLACCINAP